MSNQNISEDYLEKYLEENPEFAKNYFVNNALSSWVDDWLGTRSHRPSIQLRNVQKLSTSSAESILRPLRTAYPLSKSPTNRSTLQQLYGAEGPPSSDSESDSEDSSCELKDSNGTTISRVGLAELNEKDLFMELIRDISNELDINKLSHKILVNVSLLTNGDRCSLFLVKGKSKKRYLVSRLFDVTSTSTLEESLKPEGNEIIIPIGVGIAGTTALTGEIINIKEAYEDPRFNAAVDKQTGYKTHSILCMPIKSPEGMVIGIAQIINKRNGDHQFTSKDEQVFRDYLTFCGIGITNAQFFEISVQEFRRNQALVSLAKNIFETTEVVRDVVKRIMMQAQELLDCERCTVYLVDTEADENQGILFDQIFELNDDAKNNNERSEVSNVYQGFAAHVVKTHESMNITDIDKTAGDCEIKFEASSAPSNKKTSMLCTPIFSKDNKVIGVAQLMNKRNGHPFTENDDGLIQAFAIFCGLGIYNAQMYEKTYRLLTKQNLALELLSYHASASTEETKRIQEMEVPPQEELHLTSFALDDLKLNDDETCLAAIRMFLELDVLAKFKIQYKVLCRWTLTVRRNYRPVLYHNWRHGFNVAQTMFALFTSGQMMDWFNDLEKFVLLVACFCHDLDHRGTNNSFQTKVGSPIARLYSTSTMEHHHFDQCLMILNSDANNIFANLSNDEYKQAMNVLEHAILSTDLAVYFKQRDNFKDLCEDEKVDWKKDSNNKLLRAMMMTACDLSAIAKPWPVQQRVAELVASEFFEQGDLERSQLQLEPIPMMDREKKDELPKMQVGFINFICMPLYELLHKANENLKPLLDGTLSNKANWQKLADDDSVTKDYITDTSDQGDDTSTAQSIEEKKPESEETSSVVRDQAKISTISDKSLEITQQLLMKNGTEKRKGSSFCSLL